MSLFCSHTAVVVRGGRHQTVRNCNCPPRPYSEAEIAHKLTGIPIDDYQPQER